MLNENQIEKLPERIVERLRKINEQYLKIMGERIKEIGKLSATDIHRLNRIKQYGGDMDKITRALASISGKNVKDIYDIYDIIAKANYEHAEPFYQAQSLPYVPYEDNKSLQRYVKSIAQQTAQTYMNLSQTTAFMGYDSQGNKVYTTLSKAYQSVIDRAVTQVQMGAASYQSAMRQTLKDLADSGIRTKYQPLEGSAGKAVDYASGYSRRLDTAVWQNILWGVKECNQGVADLAGAEFGADGYEISYHSNPRPSHADMGGKQYAIGRARTINGVYYPSFNNVKRLLKDYGCLHFKFSIVLGISRPAYNKSDLNRLKLQDNKKIEFEGKKYTRYELSQLQRKIETSVRHAKDRANIAKAAGDDELRRQEQVKINQLTDKYAKLSEVAGLSVKKERMSVAGYRKVKV